MNIINRLIGMKILRNTVCARDAFRLFRRRGKLRFFQSGRKALRVRVKR